MEGSEEGEDSKLTDEKDQENITQVHRVGGV